MDFGVRHATQSDRLFIHLNGAAITTFSFELQKTLARRQAAVIILPAMSVARAIKSKHLVIRPFVKQYEIATDFQLGRVRTTVLSFAAVKLAKFLEDLFPTQTLSILEYID